jgi:hypothetical protein
MVLLQNKLFCVIYGNIVSAPDSQNKAQAKLVHVVPMKSGVFWDLTPCGLVRTDVPEELSVSFIRVTRIG